MNSNIGRDGERLSMQHLQNTGYDVVAINYHSRFGEIDIIAQNEEYIIFVEVKTRSEKSIATPKEYVDKIKQKKIVATAMLYLAEHPTQLQPRFDVIEVFSKSKLILKETKVNHIYNAFDIGDIDNAIF